MKSLAKRLSKLKPSDSMAMAQKLKALDEPSEFVDLTWGQPDFDTPEHIKQAAMETIVAGKNGYTPSRGILPLRVGIAEFYSNFRSVDYHPKTEILVTPGVKQGLMYALQALVDPGDEIILFEPCWLSYNDMVMLNGGIPRPIPADEYLHPAVHKLEAAVTEKTKAILINTPVNPTGYIFSTAELDQIAEIALKNDLYVISDEIYSGIAFETFTSMVSIKKLRENLIVADGFSKAYAMTGWRVGYLLGPEKLISQINLIHQHTATCASAVSQYAALAAINGPQEFVQEMTHSYKERRDILVQGLRHSEFQVIPPAGTFYAMIRIPPVSQNYSSTADYMLNEYKIGCISGKSYGLSAEQFTRFSLTVSKDGLETVIARLARPAY